MGVKGLWSLLNPVARPVQIESMEGKRLAIDSSIWLYQFQATMRDKDGRVLVNAHVLGFLRRINKLLFHGIKPVFVFDGGAPALKRSTIAERKRKKAGAAINHAKTAEKLFAAQMRREAVKAAQQQREQQAAKDAVSAAAAAARYDYDAGEQIPENAVYLEELEGRPGPSIPRPPPVPIATPSSDPPPLDPAEERRKKFRKHDPYKLPETVMPTVSTAAKPDARLATEEELKQFIDEVHPEDIDIESPEFRALPTEVQYEIIGDLRVRSRQQSHRRLADMLRAAPTALDFSMAQIKHLSQRNALTQQLLTVTDMVGKAHLTIPVRIAAERNREYVLVKRGEAEGGGWALGIREGTKANPIKVEDEKHSDESGTESESDEEESEGPGSDIKEISPPPKPVSSTVDPDLQEFRRREILEAIVRRYTPAAPQKASLDVPVKSFGARRNPGAAPLFESAEDLLDIVPTANDEALALALQQEELGSDEEEPDPDLARALALSRQEAEKASRSPSAPVSLPDEGTEQDVSIGADGPMTDHGGETLESTNSVTDESMDELEEVSLVPSSRNTPMPVSHEPTPIEVSDEEDFVQVIPLDDSTITPENNPSIAPAALKPPVAAPVPTRQSINVSAGSPNTPRQETPKVIARPATQAKEQSTPTNIPPLHRLPSRQTSLPHAPVRPSPLARSPSIEVIEPSSDGPMEEVAIPSPAGPSTPPRKLKPLDDHLPDFHPETPESKTAREAQEANQPSMPEKLRSPHRRSAASLLAFIETGEEEDPLRDLRSEPRALSRSVSAQQVEDDEEDEGDNDDSRSIEWSKSPSPGASRAPSRPALTPAQSGETIPLDVDTEDVDMNKDDMAAEEDDYARFLAQIKNRDLNEVRTEIDDEIRVLNNQNKVAMRDSDEITQAMINQIQTLLRHFGIPYITAPMEAEAQCAKLAELGLVDGIITDDSDVFLFGGTQCFKNIFNDAKYAECFLLADINRELSLSRDRLISLAYLLGSDYTIGLPGVGPVVALELLANFPGDDGVWDFKEWWLKVQRGQDAEWDTNTKWKKSFKKRYSSTIFLTADWPNLLVREAYKYPTTDESEEPFHWGFPKLSALRSFLHEELSWSISKVDDELTPIVQRIARRGKAGSLNKQGTLDPFFDMSVAAGNYAPRRRTTANVSKRLMSVIKQFREAEAAARGEKVEGWGEMLNGVDEEDPKGRGTGKRRDKGKKQGSTVDESGLEVLPKEDEGEDLDDKPAPKKRRTVSRKGTASSIAPTEGESVSSEVGIDADVANDEETASSEAAARKSGRGKARGRGRGRGTRKWHGERWDVIQRPD